MSNTNLVSVMCVVKDLKTGVFGMPLFFDFVENAERSFLECVTDKNENNQIAKYLQDFAFYHTGYYDRRTGAFEIFEEKVMLGLAIEFKNRAEKAKE